MVLLLGVEDAGRGPVIGPLVMAGVTIAEEKQEELVRLGVKDSKMLSPDTRERLYDEIIALTEAHSIKIIPPQEIDEAMASEHLNLNWLEAIKTGEIINELESERVIVDCPSTNCAAYEEYLKKLIEKEVELVVEHKADQNYPVVSAASIIAKVTRDREIEKIKKEIGIDFGSGYMSDEKTLRFLEENHHTHPEIFRKKWVSYQNAVDKKNQKTLGDFKQ